MKKTIIAIFAILLLLGATIAVSSALGNLTPGVSQGGSGSNGSDNPSGPGEPSEPEEPEEPEEPILALKDANYEADGKGVIWDRDLSSEYWANENGNYNTSVGIAGLTRGDITTDPSEHSLVYYVNANAPAAGDSFITLGPQLELSKYGVVVYDIDVSVDADFDWQIALRPDFVDADGVNSAKTGGTIRYVDGDFRNINGSFLKRGVGESFHYTFIFFNEGDDCVNDDGSSKCCNTGHCLVYVNGELLVVREPEEMYYDDICYFRGFRLQILGEYSIDKYASFSLSNLQVSVFSPEYEGDIYDLLENPDVNLTQNSDSILYKK